MNPIKTVIHKIFRQHADPVMHSSSSRWLRRATSVVSPRRRRSQKSQSKSLKFMKSAAPRIPSMQYDEFATPFDVLFTPALTTSRSDDTRTPSTPGTPWTPWSDTRSVSISSTKPRARVFTCPDAIPEPDVYLSPIQFWEEDDVVDDDFDDKECTRHRGPIRVDMNSLFWRAIIRDLLRTSDSEPIPKDNALCIHV